MIADPQLAYLLVPVFVCWLLISAWIRRRQASELDPIRRAWIIHVALRRKALMTLALAVSGTVAALAQCTLDGSPNSCILAGPVTVSSGYLGPLGTASTLSGFITNNSTIQFNGGSGNSAIANLASNTTLEGSGGILTLNSGDDNGRAVLQSTGGFRLLNATNTIQGYGFIGDSGISLVNGPGGTLLANTSGQTLVINGKGGLTNNGTMQANAGATIQVNSNLSNLTVSGGPVLNGGTFIMNNGAIQLASLGTGGGELVANLATIVLNGPDARLVDAGNANVFSSFVTNYFGGSFTVEGGCNFTVNAFQNFNNYGFLNIGPGSSFSVKGAPFSQDEGGVGITQVDGQLSVTQLNMDVGTVLTGTGQVNGTVSNLSSTVIPGDNGAPGTLTINGSFSQPYSNPSANASLSILLGSTTSSLLQVNGSVTLNGTLRVTSYNGFIPATGQSFDVLHYTGGIFGTFAKLDVSGLNLTLGQTASADYSQPGRIVLHVVGTIPNISNVQSLVNQALGTELPSNDLNGDTVVNVVDVQIEIDAVLSGSLSTASFASTTVSPLSHPALTDLGTLGGTSSVAYAVNNFGQVVGSSQSAEGAWHAFLWRSGRLTDLGAKLSAAYGINDPGQVVGGRERAINNVGEIVGDSLQGTWARAISDRGQVAGWESAGHAFLYDGVRFTDLGTLGGTNSKAFGINHAGEVVGASQTAGDRQSHAFLYSGGRMADLGTLGGTDSQANSVDRNGLVVGWARTRTGEKHACLWQAGRIVDINNLLEIGPGAWLEEATAINEVGQFVANASNGRAYLIALPAGLE